MNPIAVVFVVAAAVAHAGWNLCAKRVPTGGAAFVWLYGSMAAAITVPLAVITVLASDQVPTPTWALAMGLSGLLHLTYFLLLQRGYAVGDLSVVYPLARGSGPMLAVLAAVLLLGERPGVLPLIGAGLVVVGILVIGGVGSGLGGWSSGALYGLATGALIAVYTLWDAYAVTTLAVPPLVLMVGSVLCESALLGPLAWARRAHVAGLWRAHWRAVIVIAVLSPLSYVLVLFAMRLAPVSMVAPARELSIVFAGIAAWLVLGEPDPKRRLAGAVVVVAGVAAIAA
ncbi:MAG TPA: EamA family transporter [Actinophytocola sp.]|uniref:EamA family transporter n=1 Tax=Actinophytocola sp. TaxID=1872138 RepID=UPI002DDD2EF1|nr:EamA family transporter [Actinophytocola sp.]HEV2782239.1 EamA family transporter [Actinophytocola sp.]